MADLSFSPTLGPQRYDPNAMPYGVGNPNPPYSATAPIPSPFSDMSLASHPNYGTDEYAKSAVDNAFSLKAPPKTTPSGYTPPTTLQNAGSGAMAGLRAADEGAGATDTTSGVIKTLMGGVEGAAGGAVGGPVGAVVGGAIGLVGAGVNAWLSVSEKNKAERKAAALQKEQEASAKKAADRQRHDYLEELGYNRKEYEEAKAAEQYQNMMSWITTSVNNNQALKDKYVKTGAVR